MVDNDRRDFLAGLVASLALAFMPLVEFRRWLAHLLALVYEAPRATLERYQSILVSVNGILLEEEQEINFA